MSINTRDDIPLSSPDPRFLFFFFFFFLVDDQCNYPSEIQLTFGVRVVCFLSKKSYISLYPRLLKVKSINLYVAF